MRSARGHGRRTNLTGKKTKLSAAVAAHTHKDQNISLERVRAFGDAAQDTHLRVLTELRRRASDDISGIELSLITLLFAVVAVFVAPTAIALDGLPLLSASAVVFVVTLILAVVVSLYGIPQILSHSKRVRARLWLAAYEDEIARRHSQTGHKARRWKSAH